jgi:hypothetical protein
MKKPLLITVMLLTMAITGSYAQNKKVAVVSFYVSKQIDMSDFGSLAQAAALKLCNDSAFNLKPLLYKFHDQFFSAYSKNFPFDLAPESEVFSNDAYKAFMPFESPTEGADYNVNFQTPYEGYKVIFKLKEDESAKSMLAIFNQDDGVMKVDITFTMLKYGFNNMGVVRMMAYANIFLYNKNGDRVFWIHDNGKSKSVSPMVAGVPVMTPDKLLPMCESAMDEMMVQLDKDLPKMIKKADAKL